MIEVYRDPANGHYQSTKVFGATETAHPLAVPEASLSFEWLISPQFHVTIHALPDDAKPGPTVTLAGQTVATLNVPPASLSIPFGISFEEAAERLGRLPRSCVEPDGSFFYASAQGQPQWQVDGNLFDRNGRLLFVDLKGTCPPQEFDRLLSALGWPETPLAFQLVREAVLLDEAEFRSWSACAPSPLCGRGSG